MSEQLASTELERAEREEGLVAKGLAPGRIGTFTGAILGISTVAPGYTLTASIGLHRRGRRPQDARHPDRRLHPDVPHRLRLPRTELPRTRLRRVVHLVHQGLRAVRRLDVRVGHGDRHHHRAVQSGLDRRPLRLRVPGQGAAQRNARDAPRGQCRRQHRFHGSATRHRHLHLLSRHHHQREGAVCAGRVPDDRPCDVRGRRHRAVRRGRSGT